MNKVFLVFAIVLTNSVFTSCTDLDENLEIAPVKLEVSATGGEGGQDPIEEEDPVKQN
ncbi:hypothetical protein [Polaribacter sp. NJDZ03]|uniref:hypothetical protein n=1 Tax=Polaribacter sp. NJDZ03 TaxID=2855841 RepID=UPI001C49D6B4|nr:hypothetical protein [Polaribacter sp. NJDZ03]